MYSRSNIQKTIYEIDQLINNAKSKMIANIDSNELSEVARRNG